jgi:histidine triad (HIT) family protein
MVVYNIRPGKSKGKCCIVPKRHVTNIRELSEAELASFFKTVSLVSERYVEYLKPEGINYGWNEGRIAGQTVPHFHFHIVPRYKNDGLPEFHVFHRNPKTKKNLPDSKLRPVIEELRKLF